VVVGCSRSWPCPAGRRINHSTPKRLAPVAVAPAAPQKARLRAVLYLQLRPTQLAPSVAEVQANPYGVSPADQNDPDARLRAIEHQLQALLKEVKGMRKPAPTKPGLPRPSTCPARAVTLRRFICSSAGRQRSSRQPVLGVHPSPPPQVQKKPLAALRMNCQMTRPRPLAI